MNYRIRKSAAVLAAGVMVLSLGACKKSSSEAVPAVQETLEADVFAPAQDGLYIAADGTITEAIHGTIDAAKYNDFKSYVEQEIASYNSNRASFVDALEEYEKESAAAESSAAAEENGDAVDEGEGEAQEESTQAAETAKAAELDGGKYVQLVDIQRTSNTEAILTLKYAAADDYLAFNLSLGEPQGLVSTLTVQDVIGADTSSFYDVVMKNAAGEEHDLTYALKDSMGGKVVRIGNKSASSQVYVEVEGDILYTSSDAVAVDDGVMFKGYSSKPTENATSFNNADTYSGTIYGSYIIFR